MYQDAEQEFNSLDYIFKGDQENFDNDFGLDNLLEKSEMLQQGDDWELRRLEKKNEENKKYTLFILNRTEEQIQNNQRYSKDLEDDMRWVFKIRHHNAIKFYCLYELQDKSILSMKNTIRRLKDEMPQQQSDMKATMKLMTCIDLLEHIKIHHDLAHGKITPENILLDDTFQWIFKNFTQNAKINKDGSKVTLGRSSYTESNIYVAPELFDFIKDQNQTTIDIYWEKVDMFAIGVIILQMLTGKGEDQLQDINANKEKSKSLIDTLLAGRKPWLNIINGMCKWNEAERYSLSDLKIALNKEIKLMPDKKK